MGEISRGFRFQQRKSMEKVIVEVKQCFVMKWLKCRFPDLSLMHPMQNFEPDSLAGSRRPETVYQSAEIHFF